MATCLSQAVVDEIGFDRIEASGLSPDEFANSGGQLSEEEPALTAEQAPALQAAFSECGDLADAFITSESVPQEQKDCERKVITTDIAAALLANQLTDAENDEKVARRRGAGIDLRCRERRRDDHDHHRLSHGPPGPIADGAR